MRGRHRGALQRAGHRRRARAPSSSRREACCAPTWGASSLTVIGRRRRSSRHPGRCLLQGVEHPALRPSHPVPARLRRELPRRGGPLGSRQARSGQQHQLVHERAGRRGRNARHRRRALRPGPVASSWRPTSTCSPWCRTARRSTTRATVSIRRAVRVSRGGTVSRPSCARQPARGQPGGDRRAHHGDGGQALGLKTVAVYSDADRGAPHVRMADQAVRLGPTPGPGELPAGRRHRRRGARRPVLGPSIRATGFSPKIPDFARQVEAAGLVFVGPTPEQLELFGVKHTARAAAAAAGVPLVSRAPASWPMSTRPWPRPTALGYPRDGQGHRRRRRHRHPTLRRARRPRRRLRPGDPSGRGQLRPRRGVPRTAGGAGPPRRGAGDRRRQGRCRRAR